MDARMNHFIYCTEKFNQAEQLNNIYEIRSISSYDHNCSACVIKDYIKHITFYFPTHHYNEDEILIRAFCSDLCLNKYLSWRNPNHFLYQVLDTNISNEDFLNELKKFEKLIIKSRLLE